MLCYRDKTWCPFYSTCNQGIGCHRALTDQVKRDADHWWGKEGAPICMFSQKPKCYKFESPLKGGD